MKSERLRQAEEEACRLGTLGFRMSAFRDAEGNKPFLLWERDPDALLETASLGKLFILGTLIEETLEGKLSWRERITVEPGDAVPGSGVLSDLEDRAEFSLGDLAALMITVSDNTATNKVLSRMGGNGAVAAHLARHGAAGIYVNRPILSERGLKSHPEWGEIPFSLASPAGVCAYLERMGRGEILPEEGQKLFWRILAGQQDLSMVPGLLPVEKLLEDGPDPGRGETGALVWNKTGFDGGTRADAGVIRGGGWSAVYCVIVNNGADRDYRARNAVHCAMSGLGLAFWEEALVLLGSGT